MIKIMHKRDGSKEPFDVKKANGWGEWSAKTLGPGVNWGGAVLYASSSLGEECTSQQFQDALISYCLDQGDDDHNRMAGRLYAASHSKFLYGKKKPTIMQLHDRLYDAGLMVTLAYTDAEYAEMETLIDHRRDLKLRHYQVHQLRKKYALRNKITGEEFESAQFVYMRMAMALAENLSDRMVHVRNWYNFFSHSKLNPPTPNFTNLGTKKNGYVSCCLYESGDSAASLAAGDHIAYMMTVLSAGIGSRLGTRTLGDPVQGGLFPHEGKLPYYRAMVGAVSANKQNGRAGACTTHYTAFDPEVEVIQKLRNPMTPASKQIKGMDYSFGSNKEFARRVARNEPYATFSQYHHPEMAEAMYADPDRFEELYADFIKTVPEDQLKPARKVLVDAVTQAYETGRHYDHDFEEMNRHTPFLDPIRMSNLCQEIAEPTKPYKNVAQLYEPWNEEHGEIALCNLAGIIVSNIENDEEYALVAEYALRMIDVCIGKTDYPFVSLKHTAQSRMNAGVGILGLAHYLAKKHIKFSSQEGRNAIHTAFETHYWHLVNASLKISKERGVAPWINKTKWPQGWLPIDTYNKNVDRLVTVGNKRDWEWIRPQIIENGGIGHSVLAAHMPGESSTIAAGTTNGAYPIRDFDLSKTNDTSAVRWTAPDGTRLRDHYELAWDIPWRNMVWCYAVMQKWTDQSISADLWRKLQGDTKIGSKEIIAEYIELRNYGVKTRYYLNSLTAKGVNMNTDIVDKGEYADTPVEAEGEEPFCEACSL